MLYSLHNGLALFHKYTSTERQGSKPDPRDTVTCDTTFSVDGPSLPHWTHSFPSTNYCLTRFTCILFLLLEYTCFFYQPFCVPRVFLLPALQQGDMRVHAFPKSISTKVTVIAQIEFKRLQRSCIPTFYFLRNEYFPFLPECFIYAEKVIT